MFMYDMIINCMLMYVTSFDVYNNHYCNNYEKKTNYHAVPMSTESYFKYLYLS